MINKPFPTERFSEISSNPGEFRLLQRIPFSRPDFRIPVTLNAAQPGEKIAQLVILDTETTGLNPNEDKIIELGMVRATFSVDRGLLLSVDDIYDGFEDPGRPLPPEIVRLTHITDNMVRGQRLDDEYVIKMLAGNVLVTAHNAGFDRPFFDRRFPIISDNSWACSQKGIDWESLGSNGLKLEYLLMSRGWFYDAHRANIDCLALLWLLYIEPGAFGMLLKNAYSSTYRFETCNSPYEVKDDLKRRGFRFEKVNGVPYWYKLVNRRSELEKLQQDVRYAFPGVTFAVREETARTRFKK